MNSELTKALEAADEMKKVMIDMESIGKHPETPHIVLLADEINRLKSLNTETEKNKSCIRFYARPNDAGAMRSHRRHDDPEPPPGVVREPGKDHTTRITGVRLPHGMNPGDYTLSGDDPIKKRTADSFLSAARGHMNDRAGTYDKPGDEEAEGERSMSQTVAAFNAITGQNITEAEGWLLLQVLKDVRQWAAIPFHVDSAEDCVAFAALKAEALAEGK